MWFLTRDTSSGVIDGVVSTDSDVWIRLYAMNGSMWTGLIDTRNMQSQLAYQWPSREEALEGIKALVGGVIESPPGATTPS